MKITGTVERGMAAPASIGLRARPPRMKSRSAERAIFFTLVLCVEAQKNKKSVFPDAALFDQMRRTAVCLGPYRSCCPRKLIVNSRFHEV